ncbi:ornithine cyclodeaminase family protein [Amycolatopsis sp. NPDC059657]|uniref:ornithine cyclodeaminase family protein n=1 Tax=Amycolatopsis sp. NPDC059657 TaxID=3346899 RepID=UPI00366C682C
MTVRYLSRADLESVDLPMAEVVEAVEQAFSEKGSGRVLMPAKHWLAPSPDRFYSAMSSVVPAAGAAACKWQAGGGNPYLTGLLLLNDHATGLPRAIMDATWITAKRTAAASAVVAKYLAAPGTGTVGVIGTGVQGRTHIEALSCVLPALAKIRAFDIDPAALRRYATEMRDRGFEVVECADARSVFRSAGVVVTGGPIRPDAARQVTPDWLEPGQLGIGIDYDCYWTHAAQRSVSRLFTDDLGQLEHLREYGYFTAADEAVDFADVVTGRHRGRLSADETVLAFPIGVSVTDVTTAVRVLDRAEKLDVGVLLPL